MGDITMSKDAYYFSHDSNARNDQRLVKVRMEYGMEGYGIYFGIIEILREQKDYTLNIKDINCIAFDLRVDENIIQDIIFNYNLFEIEDDFFYSRSLKRRMECMDKKRVALSEAGKKGARVKAKAKATLKAPLSIKVNKSKVNKSKINIIKREEVFKKQVFEFNNQYDYNLLKDFFDYWTEPNKSNSKMLWEQKPTFDVGRRLARWAANDFSSSKKNGAINFRLDATGNAYIGYCDKCNKSDFYSQYEIKQDSKCCKSKLIPERKN